MNIAWHSMVHDMDALTPSRIRQLGLLGAVIALVDSGHAQATPGQLMASPDDDVERERISSDARALGDEGLLNIDERLAGMWTARPTGTGRHAWAEFNALRRDLISRARQVRNEYLVWIYKQQDLGRGTSSDEFVESGASFLGDGYSSVEVDKAGAWLKDRGFLKGQGAWQTEGPLRPSLTAKGVDYVENGTDVHVTPGGAAPAASFVFNGPAQVAHNSQHVQMFQANVDSRETAREIASSLQQLAALMAEQDREVLQQVADELQDEAEGDARPQRFKALGEAALRVLASGAGGALGQFVSDRLTDFLGTLPL